MKNRDHKRGLVMGHITLPEVEGCYDDRRRELKMLLLLVLFTTALALTTWLCDDNDKAKPSPPEGQPYSEVTTTKTTTKTTTETPPKTTPKTTPKTQ